MAFYGVDPVGFYGVSHVTASLSSNHPDVGTRMADNGREYVWAYNDCNSQIDPGFGCVLQSGATGMSVTLSAVTSADIVVGVCYHSTLTTGTYGWLLTRGIGVAEMNATSGTVAAKDLLEIGANGDWQKVSNTTGNLAPANGCALEAIVSSASGAAYFSCY